MLRVFELATTMTIKVLLVLSALLLWRCDCVWPQSGSSKLPPPFGLKPSVVQPTAKPSKLIIAKSYIRASWLTRAENNRLQQIANTITLGLTVVIDMGEQSGTGWDPSSGRLESRIADWGALGKKRYAQADRIIIKVDYAVLSSAYFLKAIYDPKTGQATQSWSELHFR